MPRLWTVLVASLILSATTSSAIGQAAGPVSIEPLMREVQVRYEWRFSDTYDWIDRCSACDPSDPVPAYPVTNYYPDRASDAVWVALVADVQNALFLVVNDGPWLDEETVDIEGFEYNTAVELDAEDFPVLLEDVTVANYGRIFAELEEIVEQLRYVEGFYDWDENEQAGGGHYSDPFSGPHASCAAAFAEMMDFSGGGGGTLDPWTCTPGGVPHIHDGAGFGTVPMSGWYWSGVALSVAHGKARVTATQGIGTLANGENTLYVICEPFGDGPGDYAPPAGTQANGLFNKLKQASAVAVDTTLSEVYGYEFCDDPFTPTRDCGSPPPCWNDEDPPSSEEELEVCSYGWTFTDKVLITKLTWIAQTPTGEPCDEPCTEPIPDPTEPDIAAGEGSGGDCGEEGGAESGDDEASGEGSSSGEDAPTRQEAASTISSDSVSLATGHKVERATDLVVSLPGEDFRIVREYTSKPNLYGVGNWGGLVGVNWSLNVFQRLYADEFDPDIQYLKGTPLDRYKKFEEVTSGVWSAGGPTAQTMTKATLNVDGLTYPVWRLDSPGRFQIDFFREYSAGGGLEDVGAEYAGLVLQHRDAYGNPHTYIYGKYPLEGGGMNDFTPRLDLIVLHGTLSTAGSAPAVVFLDWHELDDAGAYADARGRLASIVVRRPQDGWSTTQALEYYYYDADGVPVKPGGGVVPDSDLVEPDSSVGSDGDLIQVIKRVRTDHDSTMRIGAGLSPVEGAAWRTLVWQYRYHDGTARWDEIEGLDESSGAAHQLSMVINPEQIEEAARQLNTLGGIFLYDIETAASVMLTKGDYVKLDSDEFMPALPTPINFAGKLIGYENGGARRVLTQWLQAGCGCSGSSQGKRLTFDYEESYDADDFSVHIAEAVYNGSTYDAYRTIYYDLKAMGPSDVHYLWIKAIKEAEHPDGTSPPRTWVWQYEREATDRNLTRIFTPSAMASASTAYSPASGATAPTVAPSAQVVDGLVLGYVYNASHRITERRVSQGYEATIGNMDLVVRTSYVSGARNDLVSKVERFRDASDTTSVNKIEVTDYVYGYHDNPTNTLVASIEVKSEREIEAENGPASSSMVSTFHLISSEGLNEWTCAADQTVTFRAFDPSSGALVRVVRNADPDDTEDDTELVESDYGGITTTGWGNAGDRLETRIAVDALGRTQQVTRPGGVTSYIRRVMLPGAVGLESMPSEVQLFEKENLYAVISLPHQLGAFAEGEDKQAQAGHPKWERGGEDSGLGFSGPAVIQWMNAAGKTVRVSEYFVDGTKQYRPELSSYELDLTASGNNDESRMIREVSLVGLVITERVWHRTHEITPLASDYYTTEYTHDALGRVETVTDPTSTISKISAYDVFDRPLEMQVGTTSGTLRTVERYFYDGDGSGTGVSGAHGVGNGVLTSREQFAESGAGIRLHKTSYDWRDRPVIQIGPMAPHAVNAYDNLDRVTERALFNGDTTLPTGIATPLADRERHEATYYSQRGLPYRVTLSSDPASGGSPTLLESHVWYDEVGRAISRWMPNAPAQKTEFDPLSRVATAYITDRKDDATPGTSGNYADAASASDDRVLEQVEYDYNDLGIADFVTTRLRPHDAGASAGALIGSTSISTYMGMQYDSAGRLIASIDFGTGATSADSFAQTTSVPTWPADAFDEDGDPLAVTNALVDRRYHDRRGLTSQTLSPDGQKTQYAYDPMRRRIAEIKNYFRVEPEDISWNGTDNRWQVVVAAGNGLDIGNLDRDRVTTFAFDGASQLVKRVAHYPATATTEGVQETEYVYGVAAGAGNTDSLLDSNRMLGRVHYPDEATGDRSTDEDYTVRYAYNLLGELRAYQDQAEATDDLDRTIHLYERDDLGRVTEDLVQSVRTGIDNVIDRIEVEYDGAGRVTKVASYKNATLGGGIANAVGFGYTPLWEIDEVTQNYTGDVPGGSTRTVSYGYGVEGTTGQNHSRLAAQTYPEGTKLIANYGGALGIGDLSSRIQVMNYTLAASPLSVRNLLEYEYVGLSRVAVTDYVGIDVQLDRTAAVDGSRTTGVYPGWDRWGRVRLHQWVDGGFDEHASVGGYPNIPQIFSEQYEYDANSNRTAKWDARFRVSYEGNSWNLEYDGLDRLAEATRGTYDPFLDSMNVDPGSQRWTLDVLGNWEQFDVDSDGDASFGGGGDIVDDRSHNDANEITDSSVTTPVPFAYDEAGNTVEYPAGTSASYKLTYDAWNRLIMVQLDDGLTDPVLLEQEFNGLHWRTVVRRDTDLPADGLDQMRVLSYDASWRLLEEQVDDNWSSGFTADRTLEQFWGIRYIDAPVLRRPDPDAAGGYWHITDAQFSTMALLDNSANVHERVWYTPYGEARHHWGQDFDGDRDFDTDDAQVVIDFLTLHGLTTPINDSDYVVELDRNRDGVIDFDDYPSGSGQTAVALGQISDLDATSGPDNWIGYAGYVWEGASSLYHVRHRSYSPSLGRWVQRDPAGYVDASNMYLYGRSRPTLFVDPSGFMSTDPDGEGLKWKIDAGSNNVECLKLLEEALGQLCSQAKLVNQDGNHAWHIDPETKRVRPTTPASRKPSDSRHGDVVLDPDKNDDDCDPGCESPPGCAILTDLLANGAFVTLISTDARDTSKDEFPHYVNSGPNRGKVEWACKSVKSIKGLDGKRRDAAPWEILWHELFHAHRDSRGELNKHGPDWEEVAAIDEMNKMRDWYNKCMAEDGEAPVQHRDPFSHGRGTEALRDQERPWTKGG